MTPSSAPRPPPWSARKLSPARTNAVHGTGFEFLRNDHLIARNPFTQARPIFGSNNRLIPVTQWNQFGGSIGGAIKKNKLFYFGDYQGTRRNSGGSVLLRIPSLAERTGDTLRLWASACRSTTSARRRQRLRRSHTWFVGNVVPFNRISQPTLNLLKLFPAPNAAATADQPNYSGSGSVKFNDDAFNTRSDWYATDKLHVFGRYSFANFTINSPGIYGFMPAATVTIPAAVAPAPSPAHQLH